MHLHQHPFGSQATARQMHRPYDGPVMKPQTQKDDRAEVLDHVRESLRSALLPSARATIPPRQTAPEVAPAQLVEQFMRELDALGVKVYCPSTSAEARDTIIGLVRANGPGETGIAGEAGSPAARSANLEILAWEDSEMPLEGLGAALRAAGIVRLDTLLPADPAPRRTRLAELGRAAVGLTGTLAGLADTGTLVLLSGPARPRLASLLAPVHIALVAKRALYPTMAAFFSANPSVVREASNLVFITGPSRTADIEQTLTVGVHGPRQVCVVLLE
jgi:L-lactate dehydrogenase complex protein LldG